MFKRFTLVNMLDIVVLKVASLKLNFKLLLKEC